MPRRHNQLKPGRCTLGALREWFPVLRRALPVGGRRLLSDGVASQLERPQPRSLFSHRTQFCLVLGHCFTCLSTLNRLYLGLTDQTVSCRRGFGALTNSSADRLNGCLKYGYDRANSKASPILELMQRRGPANRGTLVLSTSPAAVGTEYCCKRISAPILRRS
jgi:hypothetical protein